LLSWCSFYFGHVNVCVFSSYKFFWEFLCSFSCFVQCIDEILLKFEWLMLESKSSCFYFAVSIENNVERVLLATYTIFLTTLTINFDFCKQSHLIIKRQFTGVIWSASISPNTCIDEVFEWSNPWINWSNNGIIKLWKFSWYWTHLYKIFRIGIVNIIEDDVSRRSSITISVQCFKVIIQWWVTYKRHILIKTS